MIKILNLNINTIKHFKTCFEKNGILKNTENIKWQFLECPTSNSFVDIAYDDKKNKTAGIYALACVKFKVGNNTVIGTQSVDTITDVDYRGKGLFTKLANGVYNSATNADMSLVYGFPNGNSIYGFQKKLEWKVLDPLPFLIKPLKSKYFTNKIKILSFLPNINLSFSKYKNNKNYTITTDNSFPAEVNTLWNLFAKNIKVSVIRDKTYLDWRFIDKPNENYKILHCYDKNNAYMGLLVYTIKNKHKGKIAYIMELIYDINKPEVGDLLLKHAINDIKKQRADAILAWCLNHSSNYKAYKKSFFMKMPEKLKPIELHFGTRAFQNDIKNIIENRKNWYLSYADSDTV